MPSYTDLTTIHDPATNTSPPPEWGDAAADNDAFLNLRGPLLCTRATRPGSPFTGQHIYESDTGLTFVWRASAWRGLRTYTGRQPALSVPGTNGSIFNETSINSLTIPDQGCAGIVTVHSALRADRSVGTDTFEARLKCNGVTSNPSQTAPFMHNNDSVLQASGASTTILLTLIRSAGSGFCTVYTHAAGTPNLITATFVPNL